MEKNENAWIHEIGKYVIHVFGFSQYYCLKLGNSEHEQCVELVQGEADVISSENSGIVRLVNPNIVGAFGTVSNCVYLIESITSQKFAHPVLHFPLSINESRYFFVFEIDTLRSRATNGMRNYCDSIRKTIEACVNTPSESAILLTPREQTCLQWLAEGKTIEEIAMILSLSSRTINFHLGNAQEKLNSATKYQAVAKAVHMGIIFINGE